MIVSPLDALENASPHLSREAHCHDTALVATPPSPGCELCVIIPAKDERERLPAALAALARQVDLSGNPLPPKVFEVIVLANNCADDSARVARRFAVEHPDLVLHVVETLLEEPLAHVGSARRLLMDEASRRLRELARPRGVIASTDADSRVGPTWVAATLMEIRRGADVVGGRIVVDPLELAALAPETRHCHLLDVGYRALVAELESLADPDPHDLWPRHFQHFGPSLAVTAEMYERVGGIPVLPWLEDVALVDALMREEARIRHSPLVQVITSARSAGRTDFGFAVQLGLWTDMVNDGHAFLVEQPHAVEVRARARRRLRGLWASETFADERGIASVAHALCIDSGWLRDRLLYAQVFGCLWADVLERQRSTGQWRRCWPLVEIRAAIRELRVLLPLLRSGRDGIGHPLE